MTRKTFQPVSDVDRVCVTSVSIAHFIFSHLIFIFPHPAALWHRLAVEVVVVVVVVVH